MPSSLPHSWLRGRVLIATAVLFLLAGVGIGAALFGCDCGEALTSGRWP